MGVRRPVLDMVPNFRWVSKRHPPAELLSRVDDPSLDSECQTVDGGAGFLGYMHLNHLGYDRAGLSADGSTRRLNVERCEPKGRGQAQRWRITAGHESLFIDKRAAKQWDTFDICERDGCEPFFIVCRQRPTLVYIARDKSLLRKCDVVAPSSPVKTTSLLDDVPAYRPMPLPYLIEASRKDGYIPPDLDTCKELALLFWLPQPDETDVPMRRSGTSFPEQAIFFYLKRDLVGCDVRSRDKSSGEEIDVLIAKEGAGIEYNGVRWHEDPGKDARKRARVEAKGIRLLQVYEGDSDSRVGDVATYSYDNGSFEALDRCIHLVYDWLGRKARDIDSRRDQAQIFKQFKASYVVNSLAAWHPEVLYWWSYVNLPLSPFGFARNSRFEAWWECPTCGFTWQEEIARINRQMEDGDRAGHTREWEELFCPHCHRFVFQDETDSLMGKAEILRITDLLPNAEKAEFHVYGSGTGVLAVQSLNGRDSSVVYLKRDSLKFLIREMLSKKLSLERHPLFGKTQPLPSRTIDSTMRAQGVSWWHCVRCGEDYLQSYPLYMTTPTCPFCGAEKPSGQDIRSIINDIEAEQTAGKAERASYLLDAYRRCKTVLGKEYVDRESFYQFVSGEMPSMTYGGMLRFHVMEVPELSVALSEGTKAYEQESLAVAFNACVAERDAIGGAEAIPVDDIKEHMPEGLMGGVSRIIKESGWLTKGRHGVKRIIVPPDGEHRG